MPRVIVTISEPELEHLIDFAQRERRDPRDQAAMLIVHGLAEEELHRRLRSERDETTGQPVSTETGPDPLAAALPAAPTRQPDRREEREA